MINRLTVSFFDHNFHSLAVSDPMGYFEKYGAEQMADIARSGFDEVVLCVTELDILTPIRRKLLASLVQEAHSHGLLVTADPWSVGGVFGGEGMSIYSHQGGKPCICEPELEKLLLRWLDVVAESGISRVFWDEPDLSCIDHDLSLELIDRFSQEAVKRGIVWNASCIRSRDPDVDLSHEVASMIAINEIAVAPYPFHPLNLVQKTRDEVVEHIAPWFHRIRQAADAHGVGAQAWLQGFNISKENMPMIEEYVKTIQAAKISNIAVWGYNACASVTDLNPPSAENPEKVWKEVCRVLNAAKHDRL